jgi:hypothetical protein
VSGTIHGTLSGTGANRTYTPTQNYLGSDSFTFKVNDGTADSPTVTVSIQVLAANTPPIAQSQNISIDEDRTVTISLSGSDADQNPLTYVIVTPPAHGSLSGSAPNVLYTPATNYSGADSFTFKVNDGRAESATATVGINIREVNDTPVANAQQLTVSSGDRLDIILSGSDPDGDFLSYTVINRPANGTLSGSAPNMNYRPNQGFVGTNTLTFVVDDGFVQSAVATITIRVLPAGNQAPTATGKTLSLQKVGAAYAPLVVTLSGTDPNNNPLTYQVTSQPTFGTLTGTAPNLTYTAATPFYGADRFKFKVNDGFQDSPEVEVWIRDNAITPPAPPLVISEISAPGAPTVVQLTVAPVPGIAVDLQRSTDLQNWTTISTNPVDAGLNYQDSSVSSQGMYFYRTLLRYTGP